MQKRTETPKGRDWTARKNALNKKLNGKTKKQLTNADAIEFLKEFIVNELGLSD
jgi:hypothetical protein